MEEELRKYPLFFKHTQQDVYWIARLIHKNPGVEYFVNIIEKAIKCANDIMLGFSIKNTQKTELEFFELINGNGYEVEIEPRPFASRIHIRIKIIQEDK